MDGRGSTDAQINRPLLARLYSNEQRPYAAAAAEPAGYFAGRFTYCPNISPPQQDHFTQAIRSQVDLLQWRIQRGESEVGAAAPLLAHIFFQKAVFYV